MTRTEIKKILREMNRHGQAMGRRHFTARIETTHGVVGVYVAAMEGGDIHIDYIHEDESKHKRCRIDRAAAWLEKMGLQSKQIQWTRKD